MLRAGILLGAAALGSASCSCQSDVQELPAGFSWAEAFPVPLKRQELREWICFGPDLWLLCEGWGAGEDEDGGAGQAPPQEMPQRPPRGLHQLGLGRLLENSQGKTPCRSVQGQLQSRTGVIQASGLRP